MLIFAISFGALSGFKTYAVRKDRPYAKYIPSGVAFAIGFLNTPSFSIARLIGGIVELLWRRWHTNHDKNSDGGITLIVIASGFVLGEGVVSVLSLALRTFGVGVASCWGCGHGMCSGC
jgi:uncharacterized oligopeptide transporter (OPT) family protein